MHCKDFEVARVQVCNYPDCRTKVILVEKKDVNQHSLGALPNLFLLLLFHLSTLWVLIFLEFLHLCFTEYSLLRKRFP